MKFGVAARLWLTMTVLTVSVLLILGINVGRQMEGLYDFHLSQHMTGQARGLIELYAPDPEAAGSRPWEALEPVLGARITTLTAAGLEALTRGDAAEANLPPDVARRLLAGESVSFRAPDGFLPPTMNHGDNALQADEREVFVTGVPLVREGAVRGALMLSAPVGSVAQTVSHFRHTLAATAAAAVAGVTLLALFLSRRLSRPLQEMDIMARAMAAGDFRQRVRVLAQDEIGHLGESINRMAATLDATIKQLADEGARLSGILSSMSDGVIRADAGGRVTLLNPPAVALARTVGVNCAGAAGTVDWSCLERLGIAAAVRQVLAESAPRQQRVRVGNAAYTVQLAAVPDEQGVVRSAVAVWQDVTQEERLEEMRRDFVANVSHEMRTPISLVRGYVEALQDGLYQSDAGRDEILTIIGDEMNRLERLVAELLELARLEAGQIHLQREPVAVGPLLEYMVRKLAPLSEQTGVGVRLAIPADLPLALADADRVEQVLLNLLDNAFRHSPAGSTVTVSAQGGADRITVTVRDHGPGVPPAERHLVWERFYRGDRARSRKKGGTGLGLAIVRGIVTAHGGEVWVEEPPGGGSAFAFTLPPAAPQPTDTQET